METRASGRETAAPHETRQSRSQTQSQSQSHNAFRNAISKYAYEDNFDIDTLMLSVQGLLHTETLTAGDVEKVDHCADGQIGIPSQAGAT